MLNAHFRRHADHALPRERVDRRRPGAELKRRREDRRPVWAAAAVMIVCLSAIWDNVRQRDGLAAAQEAHAAELAERDTQIARLRERIAATTPAPDPCRTYGIHMEAWELVHCQKRRM